MAEHRSPALVLRRLDYGESDRILSLLTPDRGRVKGFARHARNSRRRFGASLELFATAAVLWSAQQRGDLLRLDSADSLALRCGLRQRIDAFALASYACELAELFLAEGQPQPELYRLLTALLDHLEEGGEVGSARLLYEVRLIHLLGYGPHLRHCCVCNQSLTTGPVGFDVHRGGAVCLGCGGLERGVRVGVGTLGSLSRCVQTRPDRFADIRLGAQTRSEGGAVVQQVLAAHWPKTPRSLDFLEQITPGHLS